MKNTTDFIQQYAAHPHYKAPRGCTHDEPECGLDEAVADGRTEAARVDSFRRLLASREAAVD